MIATNHRVAVLFAVSLLSAPADTPPSFRCHYAAAPGRDKPIYEGHMTVQAADPNGACNTIKGLIERKGHIMEGCGDCVEQNPRVAADGP